MVPYQDFIPRFWDLFSTRRYVDDSDIRMTLAAYYGVTFQVIRNRIDGLSYEIDQYTQGIPIREVKILSQNQRKKLGIATTAYNAGCDFPLAWDAVVG